MKHTTRADGKRVITGYAIVFYDGTPATEYKLWADYIERVMPGACDDVLQDDVRGLFNHNPDIVLGRSTSSTLKIAVDKVGLSYEIEIADTQAANDVYKSIERGDIDGSSFGFDLASRTLKEEIIEGRTVYYREITKLAKLYDVGPVTFPAYEATTTGVRSISDEERTKLLTEIESERVVTDPIMMQARLMEIEANG